MSSTKIALHLAKGDVILLGPRKTKATVISNNQIDTTVSGKTRHISVVEVMTERRGKQVTLEVMFGWKDEIDLFVPKPKPRRVAFLQRLGKLLNVKVKAA